jgi:hypothetical protein
MGTQNMPNIYIYIYIYACTCISYCFHAHIWLAVDQRLSNPGKRHAVRWETAPLRREELGGGEAARC